MFENCSAELNTIEGLLERAITGLEEHQPVRKVNKFQITGKEFRRIHWFN